MPLRALLDGQNTQSYEYSQDAWLALKEAYKNKILCMPCCGMRAIPKTSKHGVFFFAHKNKHECTTAPESAEHLFLKSVIAKSASDTGWSVTTEHRGTSIQNEDWVADVFCSKGNATVAFEIQLSSIPYAELQERTARYERSKVRVAWFVDAPKFKNWKSKSTKLLPLFGVNRFHSNNPPVLDHFACSVNSFVKSLLSKHVKWVDEPWEYFISYIKDTCWKCKVQIKQVHGYEIDFYDDTAKTVPNASTVLSSFSDFITNEELMMLGLCTIGKHEKLKGNAPGYPFCNECIHCGAPQNNHYLMKHLESQDIESCSVKFLSPRQSSGSWVVSI